MKHDRLRNVAHNLADSLACNCFIIGFAAMNMVAEAEANADGEITVDFLTANIIGKGTPELHKVMACFAEILPDFCAKNDVDSTDFAEITASYSTDFRGLVTDVTIVDRTGRRTTDRYVGIPLKRPRILDHLGRLRPLAGRSNKGESGLV